MHRTNNVIMIHKRGADQVKIHDKVWSPRC